MHQDKKRTKGSSLMRGLGAALLMMLPALVFAQDAPPPPNKGDISWLMTSTVIVIPAGVRSSDATRIWLAHSAWTCTLRPTSSSRPRRTS